jgi:hypothetical protein
MSVIDRTKFYLISEPLFVCCDEHQFTYTCIAHEETMGCQFCAFDPYEECGCITRAIAKGNA